MQQAAADPLRRFCPDLDQWPGSWAYEERDIPYGQRIVECFRPFLRELLLVALVLGLAQGVVDGDGHLPGDEAEELEIGLAVGIVLLVAECHRA